MARQQCSGRRLQRQQTVRTRNGGRSLKTVPSLAHDMRVGIAEDKAHCHSHQMPSKYDHRSAAAIEAPDKQAMMKQTIGATTKSRIRKATSGVRHVNLQPAIVSPGAHTLQGIITCDSNGNNLYPAAGVSGRKTACVPVQVLSG